MKRRTLLLAAPALLAGGLSTLTFATASAPSSGTRWKVRTSIGFDAIAFLGPLSGAELYQEYYSADADAFAARMAPETRSAIQGLWKRAEAEGFRLLGPNLQVLLSTGGHDASIGTIVAALRTKEHSILPTYKASPYWSESDWAWFSKATPALISIFTAMQAADFAAFRATRTTGLDARVRDVQRALDGFDVISLQKKLSGRDFDPAIEVVLLQFVKPHGIKVQGQTFLQAIDYDTATTVRIAAHEMLHPPFDKNGAAARAALEVLGSDPVIMKIVREHDPKWGYTTLEGMLDEDLVQALDQMISEALGVGRNPADRWRKADDGMHVIAAGLYGLLREDRWAERGGSIEKWLQQTAMNGRLKSDKFHSVAARVLERDPTRLWPVA
jgi:hypothetical protein